MGVPGTAGSIGVISDTHGVLRSEALGELQGVDLIVHAGDVGDPDILDVLGDIAPVRAVRGNTDLADWARSLPLTDAVEWGGLTFYVLHDLGELDLDPAVSGFRGVISGHTHQPSLTEDNGVLFLNPGSAGPRRFDLPATVARIEVRVADVNVNIVEIKV